MKKFEDSQDSSDRREGWRYFIEKTDLKAGTDPTEATMRNQGLGMPATAVLVSPWLDVTPTGGTDTTLHDADPNQLYEKQRRQAAAAFADPAGKWESSRCAPSRRLFPSARRGLTAFESQNFNRMRLAIRACEDS